MVEDAKQVVQQQQLRRSLQQPADTSTTSNSAGDVERYAAAEGKEENEEQHEMQHNDKVKDVAGTNQETHDPSMTYVSCASCPANGLAPVAKLSFTCELDKATTYDGCSVEIKTCPSGDLKFSLGCGDSPLVPTELRHRTGTLDSTVQQNRIPADTKPLATTESEKSPSSCSFDSKSGAISDSTSLHTPLGDAMCKQILLETVRAMKNSEDASEDSRHWWACAEKFCEHRL